MDYHFCSISMRTGHFYLNPDTFTYSEQHEYTTSDLNVSSDSSLLSSMKSKFLLKKSSPLLYKPKGFTNHFFNIQDCAYYVKSFEYSYGFPSSEFLSPSYQAISGKSIGARLSTTNRFVSSRDIGKNIILFVGRFYVLVATNSSSFSLSSSYSMLKRVHFHENAVVIYQPIEFRVGAGYAIKKYRVSVLYYADTRIPTNCCIKYLCNPTKYKKA